MPQSNPPDVQAPIPHRVWLGHIMKKGLSAEYIRQRDRLSDAAYVGDWQEVKRVVLHGEEAYGETWANAIRLRKRSRTCFTC